MLDQLNQSMNLSFMNQNLQEKLIVGLVDPKVIDQNFYVGNNVDEYIKITKKKKYTMTEVKVHNFLTNISYKKLTENDFVNKSFITD